MFDVSQLDTRAASEAGVAMKILHPKTGLPIMDSLGASVTITLRGPNSEVSRNKQRELQLRRTDMARRNIELDDAYFSRERYEFLSAVTMGWTFDTMDGQPFPFTPANMEKFWADERWEWVQGQAFNYAQQGGNYLPL